MLRLTFTKEMMAAYQRGCKHWTRRVVKYIPALGGPERWCAAAQARDPKFIHLVGDYRRYCPYGLPGNRVAIAEMLIKAPMADGRPGYFAHYQVDKQPVLLDGSPLPWRWKIEYLAPRFMPGEAARYHPLLLGVYIERIRQMTDDDAMGEGVRSLRKLGALEAFRLLWDRLNASRADGRYSWKHNPWVWALWLQGAAQAQSMQETL